MVARDKERTREKRVLLTEKEERAIEDIVNRLGNELECRLTLSHLVRGALQAIQKNKVGIRKAARRAGPLDRPSNTDPNGLIRFEKAIADILARGIRKR